MKKTYGIKLDSKVMLKGSKIIKIMKRSKSRRGLAQVKALHKFLFSYKQTRNIDVLRQQGNCH